LVGGIARFYRRVAPVCAILVVFSQLFLLSMPNFFYYDANGTKQGPFTPPQIQAFAMSGTIVPETPLETDTGHRGTAGQIKGLSFPVMEDPFAQAGAAAVSIPQQVYQPAYQRQPKSGGSGIGYFDVLKKYCVFQGRASRREFWMFALVNFLIFFAVGIIAIVVGGITGGIMGANGVDHELIAKRCERIGEIFFYVQSLYQLAIIPPGISVMVRRLHDTGRSGWWYWIGWLPLVGWLILLIFLVGDSQRGKNRYGAYPK
jgi:uncharacterized membrane protein YhaH (DUF805 family)